MMRLLSGNGRSSVRTLGFVLALALASHSASAQVDENDRLARCENNRRAIAATENGIAASGIWNEETIARARTAAMAITRIFRETSFEGHLADYEGGTDPDERAAYGRSLTRSGFRVLEIAREFGLDCRVRDFRCIAGLLPSIQRGIDRSVAGQPSITLHRQQVAAYRTNMAALRCDQAGNTYFTLSGTWTGSNGLTYEISQSGNTVGWRVNSISEIGTVNVSGRSVAASWNGNWGSGSARGTVSVGPGGVANRIDWNNGVTFSR